MKMLTWDEVKAFIETLPDAEKAQPAEIRLSEDQWVNATAVRHHHDKNYITIAETPPKSLTGEEFAKTFARFVNTFSEGKLSEAAKVCQDAHRSGQQAMMRFFLMFCEEMAKNGDDGRFDDRNAFSVKIAKAIRDQFPVAKLPR